MRQSRLLLRAAEEGGEPAAAALSAATAAAVAGDVVNSISNAMVAPNGPPAGGEAALKAGGASGPGRVPEQQVCPEQGCGTASKRPACREGRRRPMMCPAQRAARRPSCAACRPAWQVQC